MYNPNNDMNPDIIDKGNDADDDEESNHYHYHPRRHNIRNANAIREHDIEAPPPSTSTTTAAAANSDDDIDIASYDDDIDIDDDFQCKEGGVEVNIIELDDSIVSKGSKSSFLLPDEPLTAYHHHKQPTTRSSHHKTTSAKPKPNPPPTPSPSTTTKPKKKSFPFPRKKPKPPKSSSPPLPTTPPPAESFHDETEPTTYDPPTRSSLRRPSNRSSESLSSVNSTPTPSVNTSNTNTTSSHHGTASSTNTVNNSGVPSSNSSSYGAAKSGIKKRGDKVLVHLDPRGRAVGETSGVAGGGVAGGGVAVNRFGYPDRRPVGAKVKREREREGVGEGGEGAGPYVYVVATVMAVHFDRDAVDYTVRRKDTGEDLRVDKDSIEALVSNSDGEKAALAAATSPRQTLLRSSSSHPTFSPQPPHWDQNTNPCFYCIRSCCYNTRLFCHSMIPRVKGQLERCGLGERGYKMEITFSSVTLFRLCVLILLVADVVGNGLDVGVGFDPYLRVMVHVAWDILVLELLCTIFIRPKSYPTIMTSASAYNPINARYISNFHLIIESLSLASFAVQHYEILFFLNTEVDWKLGNGAHATRATVGPHLREFCLGWMYFATQTLRWFGMVRYFRNGWLGREFVEDDANESGQGGYGDHGHHASDYIDRNHKNYYNNNNRGSMVSLQHHPEHRTMERRGSGGGRRGSGGSTGGRRGWNPSTTSAWDDERGGSSRIHNGISGNTSKRSGLGSGSGRSGRKDMLPKAPNIGTALMVINSHRTLILATLIAAIVPPLASLASGGMNPSIYHETWILHDLNVEAGSDCGFLEFAVSQWNRSALAHYGNYSWVVRAELEPVRCDFQCDGGVVFFKLEGHDEVGGGNVGGGVGGGVCGNGTADGDIFQGIIRGGALHEVKREEMVGEVEYRTVVQHDRTDSIRWLNVCWLVLQVGLGLMIYFTLELLRSDVNRLVIVSLRRMLKIVLQYARNPLTTITPAYSSSNKPSFQDSNNNSNEANTPGSNNISTSPNTDVTTLNSEDNLGSETTQLIAAITKITNLLRKCWGVAGAGIISANLKRTLDGDPVGFNPTVAGKGVYALFGFVGINDFTHILKSLDQNVVMLINDVAKVVHNEVFRWGHREHGQCNKNNGGNFLMVYRIGDFKTVMANKKIAADLMFSSPVERGSLGGGANSTQQQRRRNNALEEKMNSVKLINLPGITGFTDRALLGMLKSFAGIRKEESLKRWESSFELGAGVGAYSVELIFGLHAGWAVEGAVGSTYKVDATYLSPHVNMASRMMSACKQYRVFVLLSQDFEELLSKEAKNSLRHIDTVTVKGSSVAQRIYTYDVRHNGVDFFLLDRTEEGADKEADQYSPEIWSRDQDLKAMREHITPEFNEAFGEGLRNYIEGQWNIAVPKLREANDIMLRNVVDDGNIVEVAMYGNKILDPKDQTENVVRLRHEIGDGPCAALIAHMEKFNCLPPKHWEGVRPLMNK